MHVPSTSISNCSAQATYNLPYMIGNSEDYYAVQNSLLSEVIGILTPTISLTTP